MKKQKQQKNTLTAKQRKEQRIEASPSQNLATGKDTVYVPMPKKKKLLMFSAIILAAVIIFLAIFLPIVLSPYRKVNNPVAVITLSNGEVLEYEIFENEVPIAATNFIYLAKKKYFDGVIIYDMQREFMRFGGFVDDKLSHRSDDTEYNKTITDIVPPEDSKGNKFVYRLRKDTSSEARRVSKEGHLSYIYSDSTTEFQICVEDGAIPKLQNTTGYSITYDQDKAVSFAACLNEQTLSAVKRIYYSVYTGQTNEGGDESAKVHIPTGSKNNYFWVPDTTIRIEGIKLYNLDKNKWRNFNYMDYLNDSKFFSHWQG